jgi:hypothetical protein
VETIDLDSWEDFESKVSSLLAEWNQFKMKECLGYVLSPLFRGHSDASWKLQTTLERFTDQAYDEFDYYRTIRNVKPAIVSITQKEWGLREFEEVVGEMAPAGYEFMIYLRHHGFPSPLLDWTRSPYVAAFFAFRSPQITKGDRIAIYSYMEYATEGLSLDTSSPVIHSLGPYVETHKRHYAQQCEYTVCRKQVGHRRVYSDHESAFSDKTSNDRELKKYTLPVTERGKALRQLHRMNVTAFSLFGNEESLMETLAYQEIEGRN